LDKSTRAAIQERIWERNPEKYFADCLKIRDKVTGKMVPFQMNRAQREIQKAIDEQRRQKKPVRILVLKYRQGGISTHAAANLFHNCRFHPDVYMTVSLDLDSSEHIFGITDKFYFYLPKDEQKKLPTDASNRKEIKFSEPHGGRIVIETAGKSAAGHSYTLRGLHLTEVSRWPEGTDDARAGLLNSIPDTPDSIIIVESVANGMSGWFYDQWHAQDTSYEKIFVPWFWQDEYRAPLPMPREQYLARLTDDEKKLIARYELEPEQIEWRRLTIINKCDKDEEKFKEQYPSNAQEAFRTSGNAFFHVPTLEQIETSPATRGELRIVEDLAGREEIRFVPNPHGALRVWARPKPSSHYVLGSDVAEGIEIDGAPASDTRDNSSTDVLDRTTGEQVCQLHGKLTPDEFGKQNAILGRWYNNAFVGVESNAGYGLHVLETMKSENYHDHLLYRQQVMDESTRRPTTKLGWRTTKANRKTLMSNLDMALRAGEVLVNSSETLDELRSFVVKPDGRIEAGNGRKDDRVFSLAIAREMTVVAPPMTGRAELDVSVPRTVKYHQAKTLIEHYQQRAR
jgi:hypothetical protein